MDRVLLIIDDIQYSRHLEMTMRKVGFEVEVTATEFNLKEVLLSFNPDFVVCRGSNNRLSAVNVGKKLKDSNILSGDTKIILILPEGAKVSHEELSSMRMDVLLFDPISTFRVITYLFSASQEHFEMVKEKLLKFAITDAQFRNYEQSLLKNAGVTLDSEIQIISGMTELVPFPSPHSQIVKQEELEIKKTDLVAPNGTLKDQVEKNILPARLVDYPRNWQCNYCQFKEVCKSKIQEI